MVRDRPEQGIDDLRVVPGKRHEGPAPVQQFIDGAKTLKVGVDVYAPELMDQPDPGHIRFPRVRLCGVVVRERCLREHIHERFLVPETMLPVRMLAFPARNPLFVMGRDRIGTNPDLMELLGNLKRHSRTSAYDYCAWKRSLRPLEIVLLSGPGSRLEDRARIRVPS